MAQVRILTHVPAATTTTTATTAAAAMVTVPDVVGRQRDEAVAVLARAGIKVSSIDSISSTQSQPGTVLRQTPQAGTEVQPGTTATLLIAAAPPRQSGTSDGPVVQQQPEQPAEPRLASVPNVIGQRPLVARGVLLLRGFQAAVVDSVAGRGTPGTIAAQEPAAGERARSGTTVRLTLVRTATATVPDLAGRTEAEARAIITRAGLEPGGVDSVESERAQGTVVYQRPEAGARVRPGSPVTLSLAQPHMSTVPTLVGLKLHRAARILETAGLRAGTVTTAEADGAPSEIIRQSIASGTRVAPGSAVDLVVSRERVAAAPPVAGGDPQQPGGLQPAPPPTDPPPPRHVVVPNVVGSALPDARRALDGAGLGIAVNPTLADSARWVVASQSPAAGASAEAGAAVRIILQPPVATPAAATQPAAQPASPPPVELGRDLDPYPASVPQPEPRQIPWTWIIVAAAVVGTLGAVRLLRRRPRSGAHPPAAHPPVAPVLRTKAVWDVGDARTEVRGDLLRGPELGIRLHIADVAPELALAGTLIESERSDDE